MKSLSITELSNELECFGYKIQKQSFGFEIFLPLFCSIRIIQKQDRILLQPCFGYVTRIIATWMSVIIVLLLAIIMVLPIENLRYFFISCILLQAIWDVYRYILTENALNRIYYILYGMPLGLLRNNEKG